MLGSARSSLPTPPLPAPALHRLYAWLDRLPLSRPKRHVARDFSDGVLLAEIVKLFHPRLVDLHNYVPTCNTQQKLNNWRTLGRKVLSKLQLWVSEADIRRVVANTPGAIEPILCVLREKMENAAVHEDLPLADPGPSNAEADGPRGELDSHTYADPQSPQVPGHVRTPGPQTAPEKTNRCICRGKPLTHTDGPWTLLGPEAQQLLEEREQALAILQETVKILQIKVLKLEHLVRLKDLRIEKLMEHGDTAWTPQPCPGSPGPAVCIEQGGRGLRPNEL